MCRGSNYITNAALGWASWVIDALCTRVETRKLLFIDSEFDKVNCKLCFFCLNIHDLSQIFINNVINFFCMNFFPSLFIYYLFFSTLDINKFMAFEFVYILLVTNFFCFFCFFLFPFVPFFVFFFRLFSFQWAKIQISYCHVFNFVQFIFFVEAFANSKVYFRKLTMFYIHTPQFQLFVSTQH